MKVFVTGATGFIGSAIVRELSSAGHQVLGLARSDQAAKSLSRRRSRKYNRGSLEDLDSLRSGAAASDGVIHTAFIHDFSNYGLPPRPINAPLRRWAAALAGSDRPLIVTSGTVLVQRRGPPCNGRRSAQVPTSFPASRRKRPRLRWRRAECARRSCACRPRSMARAITASFRV